MVLSAVAFLAAGSLTMLLWLLFSGRKSRADARVDDLLGQGRGAAAPASVTQAVRTALPRLGTALLPANTDERSRLQTRLVHAGFYSRLALGIFLGAKVLLMFVPLILAGMAVVAGLVDPLYGLSGGLLLGGVGMLAPGLWLERHKAQRQTMLRRALPDALDVTVICLDGGLSLQGAFQRVAESLRGAHPLLASELNILLREVQLGLSTGEALRQFADRCDLEEARSLASVVLQAERLGAGIVKSLRVHAETLRIKRLQRAEEVAQMAGTKMVFPTILCIFPAILFVVAAPAAFLIMDLFNRMKD
jgi:tight adherence protein C